jgi:phosphatidylglycerol:prolipoprotein diacylglycerol transferase
MMNFLVINIPFSPYILDLGWLVLSWHGLFTALGLIVALYLIVYWSSKRSNDVNDPGFVNPDSVMTIAPWAILSGIIGARVFHVIDFWSAIYVFDPISVFYIWKGGIAIYGAVIGGTIGGYLYLRIRNNNYVLRYVTYLPLLNKIKPISLPKPGIFADLLAPGMILGMAIGRIGDVINGEHFASVTDLPWGIIYTHPLSPGVNRAATHPAVLYELIWDVMVFVLLWWLKDKIKPNGMLFVVFLLLYSFGRFFIMFLRDDYQMNIIGLNQPQIIAIVLLAITLPIVCFRSKLK